MIKNPCAKEAISLVLSTKKSIYELTRWVKEHADYLKWGCNYPEEELNEIINSYMEMSLFLYNKGLNTDEETVEDFRHLSVLAVLELENCQ